jgi:hypothetical protein
MSRSYREVFKPEPDTDADPGRIFYTITDGDVGRTAVTTTAGRIELHRWFGTIRSNDVGKRLYRVPSDGGIPGQPVTWEWQAENDAQRDTRLATFTGQRATRLGHAPAELEDRAETIVQARETQAWLESRANRTTGERS